MAADIKLRPYQQDIIDALLKEGPGRPFRDFESRHTCLRAEWTAPRLDKLRLKPMSIYSSQFVLPPKRSLMYFHVQSALMSWH